MDLVVNLPYLHDKQLEIKNSLAKRKVIRAGRRGGKTTLLAEIAVDKYLDGRRVLYLTPTDDQIDRFWTECKQALQEPIDHGVYYKNETKHIIEMPNTEQRIRGKTAWDADTARGDYGDVIMLDEYQLMKSDVLDRVVFPMLLDTDGDLIISFTKKRFIKGVHADKIYRKAEQDTTGRYAAFKFTSHDNPHLSKTALSEITQDMTSLSYRMEIMAEDIEDDPDALWSRALITEHRMLKAPQLDRIVIGVDPPGGPNTECGIVVAGSAYNSKDEKTHAYIIDDPSRLGKPAEWAKAVIAAYYRNKADRVLGEKNYGGDMVENTISAVDADVSYKGVTATRGKAVRAEPIVAKYEQGLVHHVGTFNTLEDEMCNWIPGMGMLSPNRLDGLVWALTELLLGETWWTL